jgi:hypothetical protein
MSIYDAIPSCEGFGSLERLSAHVWFDPLDFAQTAEYHRHEGRHSGDLKDTLRRLVSTAEFGFWSSYGIPLEDGYVSIDDWYEYSPPARDGYSGTITGSGAPYEGQEAPSLITLHIDYATCTFDLNVGFTVEGTIVHEGASRDQPIGTGGLYLFGQPIVSEQSDATILDGSLRVRGINDDQLNQKQTGYRPVQDAGTIWEVIGSTRAHWEIGPAP